MTHAVARTRVLAQDTLWIVAPLSLAEAPEPVPLAALGRALTRISLGAPWLEELPAATSRRMSWLARGRWSQGTAATTSTSSRPSSSRTTNRSWLAPIGRKQKKLLEELAVHLTSPNRQLVPSSLIHALARAEVRSAMLLTGDVLATLEDLRTLNPGLARATGVQGPRCLGSFLEHAFGGDVCRYAMSGKAIALRRRIGTTWTS